MKTRLAVALVGLAIGLAVPTFAQQKDAADPLIRQQLDALGQKYDEAFNNGDAVALAALYTEDGIEVTNTGPVYGREAIEKYYADLFQKEHFSNYLVKADQYSPHMIGTWGNDVWASGDWSCTIKGQNFGPVDLKGYWGATKVREGPITETV
jgi:ketosteroid isomerase-like protein